MSDNAETAILAGGCFWPAQELLRHRDGCIRLLTAESGEHERAVPAAAALQSLVGRSEEMPAMFWLRAQTAGNVHCSATSGG